METVVKCEVCGEDTGWRGKGKRRKYCDNCRWAIYGSSKPHRGERSKKKAADVREVFAFQERYARENGVYLSYGRAVLEMERRIQHDTI